MGDFGDYKKDTQFPPHVEATFGELEKEPTPPPPPKPLPLIKQAKDAPAPPPAINGKPTNSVWGAKPIAKPAETSTPTTAEAPIPVIDSKEPFKAGQLRRIASVDLKYQLSEPPAGSRQMYDIKRSANSNVPEADEALIEAEKNHAPSENLSRNESFIKGRADELMKDNYIYLDLKSHQKNGEQLPNCAKAFITSHEMKIQDLGVKVDGNGKIISKTPAKESAPIAESAQAAAPAAAPTPTATAPPKAVDSTAPYKEGEPRLIKQDGIHANYVIKPDSTPGSVGYKYLNRIGTVPPNDTVRNAILNHSTITDPEKRQIRADMDTRGIIVENAAYKDIKNHQKSGEDIPQSTLSFLKDHEAKLKGLGLTLDANGNFVPMK